MILKSPMLLGFMLSLLAGPVNATITLPNDPLTTGGRVAPNILFLLDDSGSMAFDYMPDNVPSTTTPNVASKAYTRNTLSYNPATTYQPWVQADGSLMTGGTSYTAAYGSFNLVGGATINLGSSSSCQRYNYNTSANASQDELSSGGSNVCGGVQTFYVPKDTASTDATYLGNGRNYYRYQILEGGSAIVRAEYGSVETGSNVVLNPTTGTLTSNTVQSFQLGSVDAGVDLAVLVKNTATNNNRSLTFTLKDPGGNAVSGCTDVSVSRNSSRTCNVSSALSGRYVLEVRRSSNNDTGFEVSATAQRTNSCTGATSGSGWINCTSTLPNASRTLAQELTNYATWFSYYRSRMKAAKAGAGLAFGALGQNVRVGYRTIWGRNGSITTGNWPRQNKPIPVNNNNGLFVDPNGVNGDHNNRSRWYARLYSAMANSGTPLHNALNNAGLYFSSTDSEGAYGPESTDDQLSCRQNFTVLTTDGYWNNVGIDVGEQDNANGSTITGPGDRSYQYIASAPYASSDSNTLADVAMRYWKQDLRTDMTNNVPTTSANPAFWQHMVTFGIAMGLAGNTGYSSVGEVPASFSAWPNPNDAENGDRIDDLLHAAVNGRGQFVSAADPQAFANGLSAALAAITERTGSFSNVGANSTSVDGGTRVYQASYVSGVWTGELAAFAISNNSVSTSPSWRASAGIPATGRRLFAGDAAGTAAVAFPSGLSEARLTALTRTGAGNFPVTGALNAAYLAGDRSLEQVNGGTLRNRNTLMGDIVTSSPAYVRDTDTVYVGANDGMLHAINAANGSELFAYIPGGINWSNFAGMSRPDYAHRYFVDGPIVVSNRTQTPGKNILVGALGKGGKGLYALDVTSPSTFSASSFKWEVRDGGGLMGLVQSKPVIAKLNTGATAVITANGVNSSTGQAALLVYNLETGAQIAAINTNVGSAVVDDANSNGLTSAVGWDADGNGTVDYVYGGDMLGNVWKFDLSASSSAQWAIANDEDPIFVATTAAGVRQPITAGLTLALHPRTYQPWIFFGTGRMLTAGDLTSRGVQTLYGFVEDGTPKARRGTGVNLTERTIEEATTLAGVPVRAFERRQALPAGSKGWYIDLLKPPAPGTAEGERVISDAQLFGDVLVVSSIIPTADACQADGRGYLNALDAYTGTSTGPSLFDLDGDGSYEDEVIGDDELPVGSVDLGVGMPTLAEILRGLAVVGGSSGSLGNVRIREARNVGRVSWREVLLN
ncbi:pilus assembly protein [Stenotrophomonas koreensis]|nr:PilC/PilY family type IV pilus protein [Stenotrophomonas koreensis]